MIYKYSVLMYEIHDGGNIEYTPENSLATWCVVNVEGYFPTHKVYTQLSLYAERSIAIF